MIVQDFDLTDLIFKCAAPIALIIAGGTCPAYAQTEALDRAIAYALVGEDNTSVRVIDRQNCTAEIQTELVYSIVYLNRIDPTRTTIAESRTALGVTYTVQVFGEEDIIEGVTQIAVPGMQPVVTPFNKTSWSVSSRDHGRFVKAWSYIYSHGCHGAKSSF